MKTCNIKIQRTKRNQEETLNTLQPCNWSLTYFRRWKRPKTSHITEVSYTLFFDAFSLYIVNVTNDDEQTRTNIHDLSGITTHGPSVQAIKACTSDRADTGTGHVTER
jgi:hypothetical protein